MQLENKDRAMVRSASLEALAHRHRLALLEALLATTPGPVADRAPLAVVAGTEPPAQLDVDLRHTHLPKLDALGIIDWDRDVGTFSRGHNWTEVAPLVERVHESRSDC